jgi:hypothetical protein
MKRYLLLVLSLLAIACGSTGDESGAAREELAAPAPQPLLQYTYTAHNNQVSMPAARNTDSLCALQRLSATSGYYGQPLWQPSGTPKNSASWYFERNFNPNVVSSHYLEGIGDKWTTVKCFPFSQFEAIWSVPAQPSYSQQQAMGHSKVASIDGSGPFSVDIPLWEGDSICYLRGIKGLTRNHPVAMTWVAVTPVSEAGANEGFRWHLQHVGSMAHTYANATCVYLGRSYWPMPPDIRTAYAGQGWVNTWMADDFGFCALTGIWGDLNNGGAEITVINGFYHLGVGQGVYAAQAVCVDIFDPNGSPNQLRRNEVERLKAEAAALQ